MELLQDSNRSIVQTADDVLGLVSELSPEWHDEIKRRRFCIQNLAWFEAVSTIPIGDELNQSPDNDNYNPNSLNNLHQDDYADLVNRQWTKDDFNNEREEDEDYWYNQ